MKDFFKNFLVNLLGLLLAAVYGLIFGGIIALIMGSEDDGVGEVAGVVVGILVFLIANHSLNRKFTFFLGLAESLLIYALPLLMLAGIGAVLPDSVRSTVPPAFFITFIAIVIVLLQTLFDGILVRKFKLRRSRMENILKNGFQNPLKNLFHMGGDNIYNISGQVGVVGTNASAANFQMNQTINSLPDDFDYEKLTLELKMLRKKLSATAESPEELRAVADVADAEIASTKKDGSKVISSLKAAGKWVWDQAKEIGPSILAELIKKLIGV